MKNFVLGILLIILFGEVTYLYAINQPESKTEVLAVKVEIIPSVTPIPTVSPTETPTPTPEPTIKPTKKPTPTPVPQPIFSSEQIYEFTNRFAGQYGIDPNVIRHIAQCESGFNPFARYLNYVGLFQFAPTTWKNLRTEMGEDPDINLRANAEEAVQTAAYAISKGKRGIWPNCNP